MNKQRIAAAAIIVIGAFFMQMERAHAQDPRAGHSHDGFLLRLSLGGGYAQSGFDTDSVEQKYSGPGAGSHIAIGGMVGDSLALHATLGGFTVIDLDYERTTAGSTISGDIDNASFSESMIGVGVTGYFGPNMYVSGSIGPVVLSKDVQQSEVLPDGTEVTLTSSSESDVGVGADLTFGKEWWVSPGWGLGLAAGLTLHSVPVSESDESFKGGSLSLRFSATYN